MINKSAITTRSDGLAKPEWLQASVNSKSHLLSLGSHCLSLMVIKLSLMVIWWSFIVILWLIRWSFNCHSVVKGLIGSPPTGKSESFCMGSEFFILKSYFVLRLWVPLCYSLVSFVVQYLTTK
jgi:hypothetical protein